MKHKRYFEQKERELDRKIEYFHTLSLSLSLSFSFSYALSFSPSHKHLLFSVSLTLFHTLSHIHLWCGCPLQPLSIRKGISCDHSKQHSEEESTLTVTALSKHIHSLTHFLFFSQSHFIVLPAVRRRGGILSRENHEKKNPLLWFNNSLSLSLPLSFSLSFPLTFSPSSKVPQGRLSH